MLYIHTVVGKAYRTIQKNKLTAGIDDNKTGG
jgi:hypothetical protein